mmetsp:Transcript_2294/g.4192  ORF Transcript_2294/g.4192 Transcript_2294/m.4192 type:complete len:110 (+) Transcript_2294:322-651(+)
MEEKVPSSAGAGSLVMNTKEEHEIVAGDINAGQEQETALFPETTTTASAEPMEARPNLKRICRNPRNFRQGKRKAAAALSSTGNGEDGDEDDEGYLSEDCGEDHELSND